MAEKVEKCLRYGADQVIDSSSKDFFERMHLLIKGAGVDLVFDPVGGDTFTRSLSCLGFGGRLLAIGFASGRWGDAATQHLALNCPNLPRVTHWRYDQIEPCRP